MRDAGAVGGLRQGRLAMLWFGKLKLYRDKTFELAKRDM